MDKFKLSDRSESNSIKSTRTLPSKTKIYFPPKECPDSESSKISLKPKMKHFKKKVFCEKFNGKTICESIEILPKIKTKEITKCLMKFDDDKKYLCNKTFRDEFCEDYNPCTCPTPSTSTKKGGSSSSRSSSMKTSLKLYDTEHKKHYSGAADLIGAEGGRRAPLTTTTKKHSITSSIRAPCNVSYFNDELDNIFIGKCTQNQKLYRPPKHPNWRARFTLTENPRLTQCLHHPDRKFIENQTNNTSNKRKNELIERVKITDNVDSESETEIDQNVVCIKMDLENPIDLDYQGKDYAETYAMDEQFIENEKEYLILKRQINRENMKREIGEIIEDEILMEKIQPNVFNINIDNDEDEIQIDENNSHTNNNNNNNNNNSNNKDNNKFEKTVQRSGQLPFSVQDFSGVSRTGDSTVGGGWIGRHGSESLSDDIVSNRQYTAKVMEQLQKKSPELFEEADLLYRTRDKSINKQISAMEYFSRYGK